MYITSNDIVIRDLGYYKIDILESFQNKGAFFISRLNLNSAIYDVNTGEQISFKHLYERMIAIKSSSMELKVLVGKVRKLELRLIIEIMPDEVYQKRIRKANKSNKEEGFNTSDDYKARARFNLFITNVPEAEISKIEILLIYKLRWQIELMFKTWKSVCTIDKIQAMKYERFTCILYIKLVLIALKLQLFWHFQKYYYEKKKKLLSHHKCFTSMQDMHYTIRNIIKGGSRKSQDSIRKIKELFSKNHWKEKRKDKQNYLEIIELFLCNSIIYDYFVQSKQKETPIAENLLYSETLNVH